MLNRNYLKIITHCILRNEVWKPNSTSFLSEMRRTQRLTQRLYLLIELAILSFNLAKLAFAKATWPELLNVFSYFYNEVAWKRYLDLYALSWAELCPGPDL